MFNRESGATHTHVVGKSAGIQPYRRVIASLNALLWRLNPYACNGIALSQEDAPFSSARSIALSKVAVAVFLISSCCNL